MRRTRGAIALGAALGLLVPAGGVQASHTTPDTLGHSTVQQRVVPSGADGFVGLDRAHPPVQRPPGRSDEVHARVR